MSVPYAPARWPVATATTGLWALAAASIVFWGLRLAAPSDAIAPPAVATPQAAADPAAVAQLLGAVPTQAAVVAAPEAASRFALLGVVADSDGQGAALIAVDGKPAKPFRVGAKVEEGYVLQSVTTRAASFGASANSALAFTLQLPTRPLAVMTPPALSSPPPVIAPAAPGAPVAPVR
ncbi:type II secretion system protein N [Variovorax sp. J2P1-59]|uniref:type II secretion system protein N n=1 Tax=Variovorax flavidus TaxID=3053501 RepID=UPI002575AB40|nr:type II secretion system protein N [Variovorax sp. J2P1-59]MDM0075893.1 type II secretion system protein N [Variovorax sp. J2P1-59]